MVFYVLTDKGQDKRLSQKPTQNEIDDITNEIDNDVDIIGYCR